MCAVQINKSTHKPSTAIPPEVAKKKPRFDFANLPRSVSEENKGKGHGDHKVKVISHVVPHVHRWEVKVMMTSQSPCMYDCM